MNYGCPCHEINCLTTTYSPNLNQQIKYFKKLFFSWGKTTKLCVLIPGILSKLVNIELRRIYFARFSER